jgi:hypothetical protein
VLRNISSLETHNACCRLTTRVAACVLRVATCLQWLHHKLQHPYGPSTAAGSIQHAPQHTRPPAGTQPEQVAVD